MSLVPTSPALPRIPPNPPPAADKPISLRPPHFLKQFFLRVHPDLFHAPFARVQHTALVTEDDDNSSGGQQLPADPITVVTAGVEEVREAEVSSAVMREVNESSVARLNELMEHYKQLQSLGEHTPLVASLPRPPADDGHFAFYCKQSADTTTYLAHRYTAPQTHTPIVALHAIDSFLTRLLLAAGVAIPSSLVAQWKVDWADRRRAHRYGRVKKHMPWMMDETRRAADDRQREMIRRDYQQVQLHSSPLSLQQRTDYYMRAMYAARLIQLADELTEEQRMRGTRTFAAVVGKYANQLQLEEWVGSVVRIGSAEDGYGWQVGMLRLPYNMTQQRVWETCRGYVRWLHEAESKLSSAGTEEAVEAVQSTAAVEEERERLLNEEWAAHDTVDVTEDDPEWQMTAQEVRERRQQQQSKPKITAAADKRSDPAAVGQTAGGEQRLKSTARTRKSKLSSAEWSRRLDMQEEAWLHSKMTDFTEQQQQ